MIPRRLSILGVGLLGGSVAMAVRSLTSSCKIIGYGHRPQTLQRAIQIGAIDEGTSDPIQAVRDADLVILATPVGLLGPLLAQIAPALAPGAIVTDVGSTKRSVVAAAQAALGPSAHFVGSHPMAGGEKRGIDFARTDLFQSALCILTPTPQTDPSALAAVEAFWRSLGMRITRLTPAEHDRLVAQVSHLPHAVAAALVELQDAAALGLAGKGFLDATRIAAGDAGLWKDILLDNRDNVRASIARLQQELQRLSDLLEPAQAAQLTAWLAQSAARRAALVQQKLPELSD